MIDLSQVRELIELMVEHDLSEIRVRAGETSISLRKGPVGGTMIVGGPGTSVPMMAPGPMSLPTGGPPTDAAQPADEDEGLVAIVSPMVGTFYTAPDPDSPPYVTVGSEVTKDTPVCIIEAMKVFNEIKADVEGTVERILVQNQQAVEFGQRLILVRPRNAPSPT